MKYSFSNYYTEKMTYADFIINQDQFPEDYSIKEIHANTTAEILKDIKVPEFYGDIAYMENIVLYQGSHFVDRPHYIH